jgi:hypothetical protein
MENEFHIEPMTAPPGSDDYLPCDEQHATRWYVSKGWTNYYGWFDTRDMAEAYVAGKLDEHVEKLNKERADRFTWRDGDVEHH